MTRLISAAVLAAFLCLPGRPTAALAEAGCTTPAQFGALVLQYRTAELLADLSEPAGFLRVFNAVPPVSAVEAERVMVFRRPRTPWGAPVDLIGFFTDGCLTLWATMNGAIVDRALGLSS